MPKTFRNDWLRLSGIGAQDFSEWVAKTFRNTQNISLFRENPFKEFFKIIKEDIKASEAPKFNRRNNTLIVLYKRGLLQNGDRISLLPSSKFAGLIQNKLVTNATVIIDNGKPKIKWDYDNKSYSISKLTQIILVEIGQQTQLQKQHFNGTKYWGLTGTDKSLYAMVDEALQGEKAQKSESP